MAKTKVGDELPPGWMSEEATRAEGQTATGKLVNESAVLKKRKAKMPKVPGPAACVKGLAAKPRPRRHL